MILHEGGKEYVMSHFIEQERKVIPNLLSNHKTAKEIGQVLGKIQFLHVAPKKKNICVYL